MSQVFTLIVVFLAIFTQSLTGFGSGLVSMAFLPGILGVRTAVPLVVLVTSSLEAILLLRFRSAFNFKAIWPLLLSSMFGIPVGIWALRGINEEILLTVLGAVMAGYALYALLNLKLPELKHPAWAIIAGFFAGLLSGAYSVGGPPAIIYGSCRRWEPEEFKSNLQGLFLMNDLLSIVGHGLSGNLTAQVWRTYLMVLPVLALGILAGAAVDRHINPRIFRKLVLILLVIMGLRMMLL